MTTKTQKTIVFAALIATMILPFGGMQSVYAIEEPDVEIHPQVEVEPDGTNQTDESDGSHGQDQVVLDGSNGADVEVEPSGTPTVPDEPYDGTYVPTQPQVEVEPSGTPTVPAEQGGSPPVPVVPTDAES